MFLFDDLLKGVTKGVFFVFEKVYEQADQELNNEDNVRKKLLDLGLRYEIGEISKENYETQETALLDRIQKIHQRQIDSGRDDLLANEEMEEDDQNENDEWFAEYISDINCDNEENEGE